MKQFQIRTVQKSGFICCKKGEAIGCFCKTEKGEKKNNWKTGEVIGLLLRNKGVGVLL